MINAWTTYHAMNLQYAQVIETKRIKIDSIKTVGFVFSENAFKFSLHYKSHPLEAFKPHKKRSFDDVAYGAVRKQLYIDGKSKPGLGSFIEKNKMISKFTLFVFAKGSFYRVMRCRDFT